MIPPIRAPVQQATLKSMCVCKWLPFLHSQGTIRPLACLLLSILTTTSLLPFSALESPAPAILRHCFPEQGPGWVTLLCPGSHRHLYSSARLPPLRKAPLHTSSCRSHLSSPDPGMHSVPPSVVTPELKLCICLPTSAETSWARSCGSRMDALKTDRQTDRFSVHFCKSSSKRSND